MPGFLVLFLVLERAVHCGVVAMISFKHAVHLGHDFKLAVHLVLLVYRIILVHIVLDDDCAPCSLWSADALVTVKWGGYAGV